MLHKGDLTQFPLRLRYQLVNLHGMLPVPVFVLYCVVAPLCVMEYYAKPSGFYDFLSYSQIFIPLLSVWWVLFVLREYLEADGNEVLFLCNKNRFLPESVCLFLLYLTAILLAELHRIRKQRRFPLLF